MAMYRLINSGHPANYARAVVQPCPLGSGQPTVYLSDTPVADSMSTLGTVLDARYKTGGSTTWERPAFTGTP